MADGPWSPRFVREATGPGCIDNARWEGLFRSCQGGPALVCCVVMGVARNTIKKNLDVIREEIAAACDRVGREASEVSIVAVTKTADLETIRNLVAVGLTDLGENRVSQLVSRVSELGETFSRGRPGQGAGPKWHMIGHLQRNKVKAVLGVADVIHSVDSLRLAEEIDIAAEEMNLVVQILLQVNCSLEAQKSGVAVAAAMHLAELICTLKNLRLMGLMTMAPLDGEAERARPTFTRLREVFEEIRHDKIGGEEFRHLSMGMSQDYSVAVEEGATILRIGRALLE